MSKPISAINRYKANLREWTFVVFEQLKLQEVLGKGPYASWGTDEVTSAINECYKWVKDVIGPLNATGDHEGCKVVDGGVVTPTGFKAAWKSLYQAGWQSVGASEEFGGASAPRTLMVLIQELMSGANSAFTMYPGLAYGGAEVIDHFGTPEQKALFLPKMYSGEWGGTMCLTEPHAGTDVGSARTRATRLPDGSYSIHGSKIFISGGDHDLAQNIIHLVLARVDGAAAGTKGLTLFIVPKLKINADGSLGGRNDVNLANIEHKMGINANATCALNFGEADQCVGWPVGGEAKLHQGMAQMFLMMNGARIAVGIQGISVAASAYQNALDYAKDRKQGASIKNFKDATAPRVPIIEHPDVRRMLLDMKSKSDGVRALALKLAAHQDWVMVLRGKDDTKAAYHQGQVDLLVPLVKAYGSDQGFRICETAIQVYGGAGYTRDYPVEQYCRDAKIFSIYEGTNHIQAMDLVGRKLGQAGGANLQAFAADVARFVGDNSAHETLGNEVKRLGKAQEALMTSAMQLLTWSQTGHLDRVPLNANRFLEMMAETAVAWLLLDGARIAEDARKGLAADHPDQAYYAGKIATARYYARNVLPGVEDKARVLAEADTTALEIADASF
jgi:alkylation response protein AidB-like acyl-CoA dehydrogenase